QRGKPPEWWEKQKGSRGIRRGQWYRLVFQFPIRQDGFPFMPGAAGTVALNIRHVSKLIFTHLIVNTNKK
ncbi:hypothetical protein SMA44_23710, partial [Escherichia coli]|uniref:hypothetical protein n=1 Tax=Escherichia coli TaxID=562 RepID=UPI003079CB80